MFNSTQFVRGFCRAMMPGLIWVYDTMLLAMFKILVFFLSFLYFSKCILLPIFCLSRLLHSPRLYKHIHKIHHEWTAPIGIISVYAHPLEHLLSNIIPPAIGPVLMGSHIATAWVWYCFAIASTINAHCGYHFPFFPSPEAHDYHHYK